MNYFEKLDIVEFSKLSLPPTHWQAREDIDRAKGGVVAVNLCYNCFCMVHQSDLNSRQCPQCNSAQVFKYKPLCTWVEIRPKMFGKKVGAWLPVDVKRVDNMMKARQEVLNTEAKEKDDVD